MIINQTAIDNYKNAIQVFIAKKKLVLISIEDKESKSFIHDVANIKHEIIVKASNNIGTVFIFTGNVDNSNIITIQIEDSAHSPSKSFLSLLDVKILEKINNTYFELGLMYKFYNSAVSRLNCSVFSPIRSGNKLTFTPDVYYNMSMMSHTSIFLLNGPIENIPCYVKPNINFKVSLCYENNEVNFKYDLIVPVSSNEALKFEVKSVNGRFNVNHIKKEVYDRFDKLICDFIKVHTGIIVDSFKALPVETKEKYFELLNKVAI